MTECEEHELVVAGLEGATIYHCVRCEMTQISTPEGWVSL